MLAFFVTFKTEMESIKHCDFFFFFFFLILAVVAVMAANSLEHLLKVKDCLFFLVFCFKAVPALSSWTTSLLHSHSNVGSEPHMAVLDP